MLNDISKGKGDEAIWVLKYKSKGDGAIWVLKYKGDEGGVSEYYLWVCLLDFIGNKFGRGMPLLIYKKVRDFGSKAEKISTAKQEGRVLLAGHLQQSS